MVSLSYSAPAPSSNDPIFVRTHFLGRVASDASGLDYQHELLKRRSSRHSELNRWDANWLAPVTHVMDYDSDETSDTDDDVLNAVTRKAAPAHHPRSRSSTLPLTVTSAVPVEMVRARSMTAPDTSSSSFETRTLRQNRSIVGSESRLMPARPLTIDTAQPLRMPSLNVSTISAEPSLTIQVPSPVAAVGPSPKTCSPPVVRIECSESDGSCHGDAGDQDPEAQLAAGIIRLREQRRTSSSSSSKSQRRVGSKRRALTQSPRSPPKQQPKALDDADSDDAQFLVIRKHGGNFVLRWAEKVLDFGSSALEKLVLPDTDESYNDASFDTQQSPIQPRRRSSTTPKQLNAEAGELLRRRRERISSLLPSDSVIEPDSTRRVTLTRSWSVPKLLSLPLFNPSASLRALSSSTSSTPSTPMSAPAHLHNDFGFTSISAKPSKYQEISSFDDVGASFSRQSASLYTHSSSVSEVVSNPGHVSPLWKQ